MKKICEAGVRIKPGHFRLTYCLALAYAGLGDMENARRYHTKALQLAPAGTAVEPPP